MYRLFAIGIMLFFVCVSAIAQEKQPPVCPTISVTGPAGVPSPGELLSFVASLNGKIPRGVAYHWRVSNGAIIKGQGTGAITVGNWIAGDNLTATIEIIGLPDACPNIASESAPVCSCREAILIDEFSAPITRLEKERFKNAVEEQKSNPNDKLYIIEYFRKGTPSFDIREMISRLKEFLAKEMKLDESYFEIVTETGDKRLTKIYRIPPGAATPNP